MAVEPRKLLAAYDFELTRILEPDVGGHRQLRRACRELTESGLLSRGSMGDHTLADGDVPSRDLPLCGGSLHEHGASRCAGLTELHPGVGHRGRATGALHTAFGVECEVAVQRHFGRRAFDTHLPP